MTITYVLMQNLRRNRLRTVLTALAFALPMFIFVAALSFVAALTRISATFERELRLGVHNKTALTNPLPDALRRRIEALDPNKSRLRAVCGMRWFGGRVPDTQNTLTSLAADPDTFPIVYSDVTLSDEQIEHWRREKRACVTGKGPAETYGWKEGDRLVLVSTIPPYLELEFIVAAVMNNAERTNFFYFRRDYLDESLKEAGEANGLCNVFWIKCQSADALRSLQLDIDAMTANSPDETKSEDENSFLANFTQAAGNIPGLARAMAIVVVFVITLVAGNTMMMSFRERTRELAVFKAMGFQAGRLFMIIMAESVILAMFGSLMGIVPVAVWLSAFPVRKLGFGPISSLEVSPAAVVMSLVIALLAGVTAGLWPALQALRLRTTDALRRVA